MRRAAWLSGIMLGLALLGGCSCQEKSKHAPSSGALSGANQSDTNATSQASTPTPFKAAAQYADRVADYRSAWTRLTGYEHSGLHWAQFVTIYVNKEPDRYVENFLEYVRIYLDEDSDETDTVKHFKPYSRGTIFLKEHYLPADAKPGKPLSVALMIKREAGYDPQAGDWEFAQYNVDGMLMFSGNSQDPVTSQVCVKCHQNMAERDYVFSTFYTFSGARN